jgi:hypothetical protein
MSPIFKKKRTANRENSLSTVTNMVTFIFILVFSLKMVGQEKPKEKIVPPMIVKIAFEKEFPKETPTWTTDFGAEDLDQIRYEAKFKSSNSRGLAVYDNEGNLKAYEVLIQKKDIPSNIVNYLKSNYANFKIDEASKVKNDKNEITYEIGIVLDGKFYDAVFDHEGDFLEITQKD